MRITTKIVGARHMGWQVAKACINVAEGSGLILVREPHNPHDANAIRILDVFGTPLGYVQRRVAAIVAKWMDEGYLVSAKCLRAAQHDGTFIDGEKVWQEFTYPVAVIYRESPPAAEDETSHDIEDDIKFHKRRVLEKV